MKKIVIVAVVAAFTLCAWGQDAKEVIVRYGALENSTYITLNKRTFNLLKPLMGMDAETRRLFKILNLNGMDYLQMKYGEEASEAENELFSLVEEGIYKDMKAIGEESFAGGSNCIFRIDGDRVKDFVILVREERDSTFTVMRIDCDADLNKLKEFE